MPYPKATRTAISYRCIYNNHRDYYPDGPHSHHSYEVFIHIRGGHTFQLDEQLVPLRPLDVFVIPPGQKHGLPEAQPLKDYESLVLRLTADTLHELSFRDCDLRKELDHIILMHGQQLKITQEVWRNMTPLANAIKDDSPTLHPAERQISMGCLSTLLGILCFASQRGPQPYVTERNTAQSIVHLGVYLSQNFTDDCSLDELAQRFSISKYHLSRRFQQVYGVTPHQYIIRSRITYAKRLLQQGETPSNTAQACGFNDYSAFLRAFTNQTGQSPSQWRKEHAAILPDDTDAPEDA